MIKKKKKKTEKINNQAVIVASNINIKNHNKRFSYISRDRDIIINEDCKSNYNTQGNKFNFNITQSQQDFINAVNDLHSTIDKLNI